VRGQGLICGAELVTDRATREPAAIEAGRFDDEKLSGYAGW
jgi:4-aminobutyrate aminotransferase-like enzyme